MNTSRIYSLTRLTRIQPVPESGISRSRHGFTLIEILLSLALLMLVLGAAYSALSLFGVVTTAGRIDAERSQLARAIERRMTADIRCVLFREPEPEPVASTSQGSSGGQALLGGGGAADDPVEVTPQTTPTDTSSTTAGAPTPITDPTEAYATQSVGVFGDTSTLVLHINRPPRPSLAPPTDMSSFGSQALPAAMQASDWRSISYFLAVAGGGGLQGAVGNAATGGTAAFSTEVGLQGLARLNGDRLALQQADQSGSVDLLAQDAELIAPEVTELRFMYYDGATWLETWDSVSMNAVPRAIEVTLRIDVGSRMERPAGSLAPAAIPRTSDVYRFVIALPLSDPTLGLAL